ncbi:MAG TPA: molybdenum cofactor biosynthesis protein MoaE [Gemmatimonadaceae bacterium]|jgi:molybdopterin synthase catalytic subunit
MKRSAVVTRVIDPTPLIAEVKSNEIGAISVFLGTVRDTNDGQSVTALDYSAYTSMAESELSDIVDEAETRFGIHSIIVEHRVGELSLGEVSVAIVTAHQHRQPAIDCAGFVIDEIKKRVPIWKREHYADGSRVWVDPTRRSGATPT